MLFLVGRVSWPGHAVNKLDPDLLDSAENGVVPLAGSISRISTMVEEEWGSWGSMDQGLTGENQGIQAGYVGETGDKTVVDKWDSGRDTKEPYRRDYG